MPELCYAMMTLFKNKYRIETTRLPSWDYSQPGYYFITIGLKPRKKLLGKVINNDVRLSPIGEIVAEEWIRTGEIRQNVLLDEWIVMPDHVHMILVITHKLNTNKNDVTKSSIPVTPRSMRTAAASKKWAKNSVGSIIGQYKSKCTKRIWDAGYRHFGWHPGFYDRIIRTEDALFRTRRYIRMNPVKWR